MSYSRSPSPRRSDWASPGLNSPFETLNSPFQNTHAQRFYASNNGPLSRTNSGLHSPSVASPIGPSNTLPSSRLDFDDDNDHLPSHGVSWAAARAKSDAVNGYPSFSIKNQGFFSRGAQTLKDGVRGLGINSRSLGFESEKDRYSRRKYRKGEYTTLERVGMLLAAIAQRLRLKIMAMLVFLFLVYLVIGRPILSAYRRTSFLGGGSKFVIVLGANVGGGVMEWKGPREWAIERDSVRNKKKYAQRWGYDLEIVDLSTKKRYAHEWRESWEKADSMRNCMRKYPNAEWFWWLDLNTYIMEPSVSLQKQIFDGLTFNTYRDINHYNPLNITHPLKDKYLDAESRSPTGDSLPSSIDLIVPQDCSGFNLGSFFLRRSTWTDRLLDVWWDPVLYEQKHMEWEHKEQDALEHLYTNHPWVRSHTAFIEQRKINAFPPGACGSVTPGDRFHYSEDARDFVVNMAGCQYGRDCWGEMYNYRELSNKLNKGSWLRLKESTRKGMSGWTKWSLPSKGSGEDHQAERKEGNLHGDRDEGDRGKSDVVSTDREDAKEKDARLAKAIERQAAQSKIDEQEQLLLKMRGDKKAKIEDIEIQAKRVQELNDKLQEQIRNDERETRERKKKEEEEKKRKEEEERKKKEEEDKKREEEEKKKKDEEDKKRQEEEKKKSEEKKE